MNRGRLPVFALRVCSLILGAALLESCYVIQQAGPFLSQRMRAVPIDKLLAGDEITPEVRRFLLEVQDIRQFAEKDLSLAAGKNYTGYVTLDRNYLAAVIQAAPEFSTDPYLFWYPFLGKLPYRGYYDPKSAISYGKKLESKGLDVFIRPVDAFSSLGFFKDPLYSFMADYPAFRIAELIIHEETHATVFFKKYPDFNEKLATFVGTKGAELYLEHTGRTDLLDADKENEQKNEAFKKDVFALSGRLDELYGRDIEPQAMRAEKKRILDEFRQKWELPYEVNNAFVSLYSIYEEPDNRIEKIYLRVGSVPALMTLCEQALKDGVDPWTLAQP